MKKINVFELLKDCPEGMKLDCAIYDDVTFKCIVDKNCYPIQVQTPEGNMLLSQYGSMSLSTHSKCVIFPKGKTTWEGFVPPCKFKDGDIVALDAEKGVQLFIFKEYIYNHDRVKCYMMLDCGGEIDFDVDDYYVERFATEEEKQKLFKAIKDNGYRWNTEIKALEVEELVTPKFKVGDIVKSKNCPTAGSFVIVGVEEDSYSINLKNYRIEFKDQDNYELINEPKFKVGDRIKQIGSPRDYIIKTIEFDRYILHNNQFVRFGDEHVYELIPNKFNITTLKPFDSRVLVRDCNSDRWKVSFWGCLKDSEYGYKYDTVRGCYKQCIPYEGNEHLLGKTDNCIDFYKNW